MNHVTVATVMTSRVATAVPDTPYRELVGLLLAHDIDLLPVIDVMGRPVGVVTDHELFAKLEHHGGTDPPPLFGGRRVRVRRTQAAGVTAAAVMSTPAPTVSHDATLGGAIRALSDSDRRHLCVVDDSGYLVGTLSRRDVLRVFLRSDAVIHHDLEHRLNDPARCHHPIGIDVTDGVVALTGTLAVRSLTEQATRIAHRVAGVITVHNELDYDYDDLTTTGL
ncbi:MAG TPA: CBS domain-containing protein [Actinokineospora sp.]|nr:CBS domain-containing protein [Actinokineospora sp.]